MRDERSALTRDGDTVRRFLFEKFPVRGYIVHLDASWRALFEHHDYPDVVRQTLGEAAYARIRDAVLTTSMRPGATVSEQELALEPSRARRIVLTRARQLLTVCRSSRAAAASSIESTPTAIGEKPRTR